MSNFRFYQDKSPNIVAVYEPLRPTEYAGDQTHGIERVEGYAGIYMRPNSPVAWVGINLEMLATLEEVTEEEAREIHPALFERLDADSDPSAP